jgi:hypothetical protein
MPKKKQSALQKRFPRLARLRKVTDKAGNEFIVDAACETVSDKAGNLWLKDEDGNKARLAIPERIKLDPAKTSFESVCTFFAGDRILKRLGQRGWGEDLVRELSAVQELERLVNAGLGMKLNLDALEKVRAILSERLRISFFDVGRLSIGEAVRVLRSIVFSDDQVPEHPATSLTPLRATLAVCHGSLAKSLIEFLAKQPEQKATRLQLYRHIYKSVNTPNQLNWRKLEQLVRRTASNLHGKRAALRIAWNWDQDVIRLEPAVT